MSDIVGGRYRVEQKLAAGGFGAIYRATDLQIGRQVALKVLHRELAGDANVVARFRREAAALATLKSPHTLTLYDVGGGARGSTEDTLYIVMELLRGESLQDVFDRSGTLPWRRMAQIARGVCNSLREAHDAGIVHRDLKPANTFLENHALESDFVKVLDFGIAKILDTSELYNADLTQHGQMIGTFDYMAPEQMVGGCTTARTDVFTLGVVMYEMLAGTRPFGEPKGPATMLMSLLSTTPVPLTGIPPALARIIIRCLEREPEDRPTVVELDDILAGVLDLPASLYGDENDATLVEDRPPESSPPVRRRTLRGPPPPRSNRTDIAGDIAAELEGEDTPPISMMPLDLGEQVPLAVQPRGSNAVISSVDVSFYPTRTPEPPRTRLASGTSPIVTESSALVPSAHERAAVVTLRWIAIAVALIAASFFGAVALSAVTG
jgi:serine/threonine protein kinase